MKLLPIVFLMFFTSVLSADVPIPAKWKRYHYSWATDRLSKQDKKAIAVAAKALEKRFAESGQKLTKSVGYVYSVYPEGSGYLVVCRGFAITENEGKKEFVLMPPILRYELDKNFNIRD